MPSLDYIFKRNPIFKFIKAKPGDYYNFSNLIVRERLAEAKTATSSSTTDIHKDLTSYFIAAQETHPDVMTDFRVAMMATTNITAGTLSTSMVLDRMILFLAQNPAAQDRLYEEIKTLDHHDITTSGEGNAPASLDFSLRLPYLEAVIFESYRLHSSVANNFEHVAPAGGLTLPNGYHLPAGTVISFNAPASSRHIGTFEPDAEIFEPLRWMQKPHENDEHFRNRKTRMERSMLTFGYGSRSCLGKNIVQLEMFKVWATLLGLFQFEAVGEPKPHQVLVKAKRRHDSKDRGGEPIMKIFA